MFKMDTLQQASLSKLHRNIRLSNWQAMLRTLSEHTERIQLDHNSVIHHENTSIVPLLLQTNSIGWSSVHFTALHGAPDLFWWKWMLTKVLEEYDLYLRRMRSIDNIGIYYEYLVNPFLRRTQAGHSATDLFFSKRLHPFLFEKLDVRRDAELLVQGINIILKLEDEDDTEHAMIVELRRRIQEKMDDERLRQRRHGTSSNFILLGTSIGQNPTSRYDDDRDGLEELEHEMSLHEHVHEEQEDHTGVGQNALGLHYEGSILDEENIDAIVKFWHEMELLVMAATHLSLYITDDHDEIGQGYDGEQERLIVHGLAKVGCPNEIGRLAVKLYPEQVRQIDINGNLPLHIASLSHKTSALAAGIHGDQTYGENATLGPPMMKCLIDVYPGGASEVDSDGRYPINLAILAGKTWLDGVGDIFRAGPNVIISGSLDSITRLPSFMIAALPRRPLTCDGEENINDRERNSRMDSDIDFEEEMRAKRNTSKTIGSMWRFLPDQSKLRAVAEARRDIEMIQLNTIFELLRIAPDLIFRSVSHHKPRPSRP